MTVRLHGCLTVRLYGVRLYSCMTVGLDGGLKVRLAVSECTNGRTDGQTECVPTKWWGVPAIWLLLSFERPRLNGSRVSIPLSRGNENVQKRIQNVTSKRSTF